MILSDAAKCAQWAQVGYYGGLTLDGALSAIAVHRPDQVIFSAWSGTSEKSFRLTAAGLDHRVSAVASMLLDTGLKQDDPVLVQIAPRAHSLIFLLACSRAGLISVPIPGISGRRNLRRLMERTAAKAGLIDLSTYGVSTPKAMIEATAEVFDMRFLFSVGGQAPDGILPIDRMLAGKIGPVEGAKPVPRAERPADHVAMVWPQADEPEAPLLARSHNELMAAGLSVALATGLSSEDVLTSPLLPQRLSGLSTTLFAWLVTGAALKIVPPQDWAGLQKAVRAPHKGRQIVCLPGKLACVAAPVLPAGTDILRVWGDPLAIEGTNAERNDAMVGPARIVADAVNIAECGLAVSSAILESKSGGYGDTAPRPGAIPLAGLKRDEDQALPPFLEGRLTGGVEKAGDMPEREGLVRGQALVAGPTTPNAPWVDCDLATLEGDAPASPFEREFMRTGLRGQLTDGARGPELRIIGTTESVRRAGVRTYAMRELDRIFASMPGIQDAAAFEIPGGPLGQRIGAAIVPAASAPTLEALRRAIVDHGHSPHLLPEKLVILQTIPRAQDGGVHRDALVVDRLAV